MKRLSIMTVTPGSRPLRLLPLVSALLMLFMQVPIQAEGKVFRLSHDDYRPFHWYDPTTKEAKGIFIDICEELLNKRLGYNVVYTQYPWKRAQMEVDMGRDDAYISTPTPLRLRTIIPCQEPLIIMQKKMYTYRGNPKEKEIGKIKHLKELKPYRILGYLGDGWAKRRLVDEAGLKVDYVAKLELALKMLAAKRGDVFISTPEIVNYYLAQLNLKGKVVELPVVIEETEFSLCISRKSTLRKKNDKIDATLKEMKEDGTMEKIMSRWR